MAKTLANVVYSSLNFAVEMGYTVDDKSDETITIDLFLNSPDLANDTYQNVLDIVNLWRQNKLKEDKAKAAIKDRSKGVVYLTYFKPSGKYYSSGEYVTERLQYWDVVAEVKSMQASGDLPGLVKGGGRDFTIHMVSSDGIPVLIKPIEFDNDKI